MIFTAEQARLILARRKTQTRRVAVPLDNALPPTLGMSEHDMWEATKRRIGQIHPVERLARGDELAPDERIRLTERPPINPLTQMRRKRRQRPRIRVGHILLTEMRLERLGGITLEDANAEGFQTVNEFKAAWTLARDSGWRLDCPKDANARTIQLFAIRRFQTHYADSLVWVLSFELTEAPNLLKATASFDDYTDTPSRAMRGVPGGEPEAITGEQLEHLTQFSVAKDDARRRQPLATHAHNMARELDELRERMPGEGLHDQSLWNLILAAERIHERIRGKLEAA